MVGKRLILSLANFGSAFWPTPRVSLFRRRWTLVAAVVAVTLCGYFGWRHFFGNETGTAGPGETDGLQKQAPIPVTVAQAKKADFPVYLNGLGIVEPYQTPLLCAAASTAQVIKVAFKQGQMVKEGDVLVADRSAPVSGSARSGGCEEGAGRGEPQGRAARPAALRRARQGGFRLAPDSSTRSRRRSIQLVAQIKGDQASIDNAQTQVSYTTIRSPLSGKTGFRLVDPGNIVHAADTTGIVTIVQLQPISVVFTAPEEDVPQINKALAAGAVPVTALSSDGLKTLSQGHLALVNNAVDQASGTIRMKATFANTDNVLWPGLSVSTRLLVDTLKQVTVVPDDAIQHGPNGLYAYVVGSDNKVEMRDITGRPRGSMDNRSSCRDCRPAQKVVTAGQYRLRPGLPGPVERGEFSQQRPRCAAPSALAKAP